MNKKIISILKEKPLTIPRLLFQNYKNLNISEEELVVLIILMNEEEKILYNPIRFAEELNQDKYKVMQLLNNLSEKNIIEVRLENNSLGKKEEYIYLDLLYNKLFSIVIDTKEDKEVSLKSDIFSIFEQELGRTISPMEVEIIKEWLHDGISEEIIKEALKEAISNNVRNLKYIDRIIFTWNSKGLKTKEDILKDKRNYRIKDKQKEEIYDYNWLEEE